jgi:hypothetical protein
VGWYKKATFYAKNGGASSQGKNEKIMGRDAAPDTDLAFSVPWLTLLAVCGAAARRFSASGGALIGTLLGAFFGLAFGGALPRGVADYCFGPEEQVEK